MLNVLVVDDEESILDQASIFLKNQNDDFNIFTGRSVEEGFEIVRQKDIDIVISDYQMPEKTGLDFLETLRKEEGENIPFIIFTGKGREEVAKRALNLGANRYIQKGGNPKAQYDFLARTIEKEIKHKRTEEEVRCLRNEYRELFNNVQDMVFIHDLKGDIKEVNNTACEVLGYEKEELLDMNLRDIDSDPTTEKMENRIRKLKEEKSIKFEGEHITESGKPISVEINSNLIEFRGEDAVLGVARDITERKKRERQIKHLNEIINVVRKINQLIVKKEDLDELIDNILSKLIGSHLFKDAWIGLKNKKIDKNKIYLSESYDPNEDNIKEKIEECMDCFLSKENIKVIKDHTEHCKDCEYPDLFTGEKVISIKIDYDKKTYGVLNISFSSQHNYITSQEESDLIKELADDIGYALYNIEKEKMEEKMKNIKRLADSSGSYQRLVDDDYNVFAQNEDMKRLTSVSDEEIEDGNIKCYEQLTGNDCHTEDCSLRKVQREDRVITDRVEKSTGDGKTMTTLRTVKPIKNEEGDIIGVAESFKDISNIKHLIEKLKEKVNDLEDDEIDEELNYSSLNEVFGDI